MQIDEPQIGIVSVPVLWATTDEGVARLERLATKAREQRAAMEEIVAPEVIDELDARLAVAVLGETR
jgi:hypothetical protein